MNVVTPLKPWMAWVNKLIFKLTTSRPSLLKGLLTLSLIHYARWVIVMPHQFPRLSSEQPKEDLEYAYMFFFSNFNGSWAQYVDSFSMAIPGGLDAFWYRNIKYPKSVPTQPFHDYITYNQIWTNHYYNSYPMASSNDVKSAKKVKAGLIKLIDETHTASADEFKEKYDAMLVTLQHDLSRMAPTPVVSLAVQDVEDRRLEDGNA